MAKATKKQALGRGLSALLKDPEKRYSDRNGPQCRQGRRQYRGA